MNIQESSTEHLFKRRIRIQELSKALMGRAAIKSTDKMKKAYSKALKVGGGMKDWDKPVKKLKKPGQKAYNKFMKSGEKEYIRSGKFIDSASKKSK